MVSRRRVIARLMIAIATMGLIQAADNPVAWWSFNKSNDKSTIDAVSQASDYVGGKHVYVDGAVGSALRFDGYTTKVVRQADQAPALGSAFSIEAWVSFQAYPWGLVSIVSQHEMQPVVVVEEEAEFTAEKDPEAGYYFAVDARGYVHLQMAIGGEWVDCKSDVLVPLMKWSHIVGTYDAQNGLAVYINGKKAGSAAAKGRAKYSPGTDLIIGQNHIPRPPEYPIRLNIPALYSFDGFIDEVKIYDRALSEGEISGSCDAAVLAKSTGMTYRKLPTEPKGPAPFGAYYTHLEFDETWDAPRREGPDADVVVMFDDNSWRYVFWRGTGYIPHWVTENDIWYTNEFNETWGHGALGCAEPMSDKQCRYSNVRIIENTPARVVIHWRYALVDTRYVFARMDEELNWGDWSDEYHYIYPDAIGIRKIKLWSSQPLEPHEFQESIVLNQAGTRPEDNIEDEALTMVNMDGEAHTYSWAEQAPLVVDKPARANIEYINTKSKAKPFLVVSDRPFSMQVDPIAQFIANLPDAERDSINALYASLDDVAANNMMFALRKRAEGSGLKSETMTDGALFDIYNAEILRENSIFPWWNHWPVGQIPSDGRWATSPDRTAHSSLTTGLEWENYEVTDYSRTRIMMVGLTEKPAVELAPLARSWLRAPKLSMVGKGYASHGYEEAERAYMLSRTGVGKPGKLEIELASSEANPVVNPAFVVKGWGDGNVAIKLNGKKVKTGTDVRVGHVRTPDGTNLIVWLRYESSKPMKVSLTAGK